MKKAFPNASSERLLTYLNAATKVADYFFYAFSVNVFFAFF
jgi:hypothetical protein